MNIGQDVMAIRGISGGLFSHVADPGDYGIVTNVKHGWIGKDSYEVDFNGTRIWLTDDDIRAV